MKKVALRSFLHVLIGFLLFSYFALSETISQEDSLWCNLELISETPGGLCLNIFHQMEESGPFFLRVKPHIIRNSNGQFGYSESDVQTVMENLYEDFSEHNIFFIWDCQVNYIDDDDFFAGNKGSHLLFFENGSNSFIDMFFLPSSHPSLFSAVNEIPGNAFFIGGTAYYDNNIELISTRVVSHEMGHCLGLFHTHHTGTSEQPAEYVNGDDCEERGDCVCDTPADPGMGHNVSYPSCEWIEPDPRPKDGNYHYYSPDPSNIMSYSHSNCLEYFTEGQGQRMRNIIAWSEVLQMCLVEDVVIS